MSDGNHDALINNAIYRFETEVRAADMADGRSYDELRDDRHVLAELEQEQRDMEWRNETD